MTEPLPLIDRTIDDVARAMTSARQADLRAAVLPRLASRRPSGLRWIVPAAAIATVVVVAFVTRHSSVSIQTTDGGPVPRVASNPSSPSSAGPHSAASTAATPETGRRSIGTTTAVTVGDSAPGIQSVPPLDALSAIAVTSIQPMAAGIPQLAVAPIDATAPIVMPDIGRER